MTKNEKSSLCGAQKLFCAVSIIAMFITFRYTDIAIASMSQGMKLCTATVIPALFPFMVLSELLVSSGASELIGRYLGAPFGKLFGLSRDGAAVFLLGMLCGFPVATKSAVSLYERGRIDRGELEHLCSFCNGPSSAFLISAVGVKLFGSRSFGVLLYIAHIISSIVVGLAGKRYFKKRKEEAEYFTFPVREKHRDGVAKSFTSAVTGSAESMLFICAFIVFFSAVIGLLRFFAEQVGMADALGALCFGFFEMTGGVSAAAELPPALCFSAAALITGWSGLSVHFQFIGVSKGHILSLRPYFFAKLLCALLNLAVVNIAVRLFGEYIAFGERGSAASVLFLFPAPIAYLSLSFFFVGCLARLSAIKRG